MAFQTRLMDEPIEFQSDFLTQIINEEQESELKRKSSDYIKWVQQSLNQIMRLRLEVDGILGPQTHSAIRSFQASQGLKIDGIVGSQTEAALKAALGRSTVSTNSSSLGKSQEICARIRQPVILDHFEFDKDILLATHRSTLERIVQCVVASQTTSRPVRSIRIVGHTDPAGSARYNLYLGKRRAEQTRWWLSRAIAQLNPRLADKITFIVESMGETQPISNVPAESRRVEVFLDGLIIKPLPELTAQEKIEFEHLDPENQTWFSKLRKIIENYTGVARREADQGSRVLLLRGVYRALPHLLREIINLTNITRLPSGWSSSTAKSLLVGNVLYNLAFPETINQGGKDRLGGKPDPTCFSASTQILLARRFPVTYVRLTIQLATTSKATFAGGDNIGPLTFVSTSLYKSLDSVLLQTAFDRYFYRITGSVTPQWEKYTPGDELKVHRQVFGSNRSPRYVTTVNRVAAFRKAFITNGGNTRLWEIINLCTGNPAIPKQCGNHSVVLTRITGGRVYFYNPWANEEERNWMFGTAAVFISGHGERPAESSMTQADFENQITAVFHN